MNKNVWPWLSIFSRVKYPVLLFLLHTVAFAVIFPRLDLPVADDANYFGYAKLFARHGIALYGDWTPLLTYFGALLYWIFPVSPVGLYAVYSFGCKLTFVLGAYAFLAHFTNSKSWAFGSTLWVCVFLSYWRLLNGHLFPVGGVLLLLTFMVRKKSLEVWTVLAVTAISVLLRSEYILLAAGIGAGILWRHRREASWRSLFRFSRSTILLLVIALLAWTPFLATGTISTGRLQFAFAQKFSEYALKANLYPGVGLEPGAHWFTVTDHFFPKPDRDSGSILSRIIPLYEIASAKPVLFGRFVWNNLGAFFNGEFFLSESNVLTWFLYLYITAGIFGLFYSAVQNHQRQRSFEIYLSLIFLFGILPCLVTRPLRNYLLPTILWYTGVLPSFLFETIPFRQWFLTGIIILSLIFQYPQWREVLSQEGKRVNYKRLETLRLAAEKVDLHKAVLAEAYPVFGVAFTNEVFRSVHYNIARDAEGKIRAQEGKGPVVNYVLLEKPPLSHPYNNIESLKRLLEEQGELVAQWDRYSFWTMKPSPSPKPTVTVTDDLEHTQDLSNGTDRDPANDPQFVIRWNFGAGNFKDFHVYVSVDGSEFQYLGRTASDNAGWLVWKKDQSLIALPFQAGPEFGHSYLFKVFGIPADASPNAPKVSRTSAGPVQFMEEKR